MGEYYESSLYMYEIVKLKKKKLKRKKLLFPACPRKGALELGGVGSTRTTFPEMHFPFRPLLAYGNCRYTETVIHKVQHAFGGWLSG